MAKLRKGEILEADLMEYLTRHSDFGFELRVLKALSTLGLRCEHGGVYEDPVTRKTREFDIRARSTVADRRVRVAVERSVFMAPFAARTCAAVWLSIGKRSDAP